MADTARIIALEECKEHNNEKTCWIIVHGKVYDVTDFLEEHPGGFDIILNSTGKDATQDFDEIGHSKTAHQILAKYLIGVYAGGEPAAKDTAAASRAAQAQAVPGPSPLMRLVHVLLPLLLILAAVGINMYISQLKRA